MPRKKVNEDIIFGEDALNKFEHAYPIEMYMENVTGMEGEGDFISKFGLDIKDEVTMLVSRRRHPNQGLRNSFRGTGNGY